MSIYTASSALTLLGKKSRDEDPIGLVLSLGDKSNRVSSRAGQREHVGVQRRDPSEKANAVDLPATSSGRRARRQPRALTWLPSMPGRPLGLLQKHCSY